MTVTSTEVPIETIDDAPRAVVRPTALDTPVRIESFSRRDIAFEVGGDPSLKYGGNASSGAVLVALNVDGEGFDHVTVESQRDSEAQAVSAIEALRKAWRSCGGWAGASDERPAGPPLPHLPPRAASQLSAGHGRPRSGGKVRAVPVAVRLRATLDDEVERAAMALGEEQVRPEALVQAVAEEFAREEQVRPEALVQAVAEEFAREEPAREEGARLRPVEST